MKIGVIGMDTSHVEVFKRLLDEEPAFKNDKITIGSPRPSKDIKLSLNRVEQYTAVIQEDKTVEITNDIKRVAKEADAILLTALDGREHAAIFRTIAPYRKPVFIDKPIATTLADTKDIFAISEEFNTKVMTSSALRFTPMLIEELKNRNKPIKAIYISAPMPFVKELPYYTWYGIHAIETLFTIMGESYKGLHLQTTGKQDVITFTYEDGRTGLIRGTRKWHKQFEVMIHYEDESVYLPLYKEERAFYHNLLSQVMTFFRTKESPIPPSETIAIMKSIEELNILQGKNEFEAK